MRIAMAVEYDGASFFGWQVQLHSENTVQAVVERAISRVANEPIRVVCAGRTDTGVHGSGQVIHFDTQAQRDMHQWVFGANANLPKSVAVLWAQPVDEDFHARFSAISRRYQYVIVNRPVRPTFLQHRTTWEFRPLDETRMIEAARYLVGQHDFTSYRAQACQAKSPVRNVTELTVTRRGPYVIIDIEANGFLHHMVRNISGVLMDIGAGKHEPIWAKEILEHRDRKLGGVTAPPAGLYLTHVGYPDKFGLPALSWSAPVW
ncbi:MAG: tRNA pseudouridine(38-40) synthase TruA [Gammaproteobacteria bacterium]|nr:tRNA pseudouridine(38-40) synthase TruA [Gammaproteobacteria bacterium]